MDHDFGQWVHCFRRLTEIWSEGGLLEQGRAVSTAAFGAPQMMRARCLKAPLLRSCFERITFGPGFASSIRIIASNSGEYWVKRRSCSVILGWDLAR